MCKADSDGLVRYTIEKLFNEGLIQQYDPIDIDKLQYFNKIGVEIKKRKIQGVYEEDYYLGIPKVVKIDKTTEVLNLQGDGERKYDLFIVKIKHYVLFFCSGL